MYLFVKVTQAGKINRICVKKCYILYWTVNKYVALLTYLSREQQLFTKILLLELQQIYAFLCKNELLKFLNCVRVMIIPCLY